MKTASLLAWFLAAACSGDDIDNPPGGNPMLGDRDGGDSSPAGDPDPGLTWLSNADFADPPTNLAPDPGEEGFWVASRLTPPTYPFTIDRVAYTLADGAAGSVTCAATLAHRVRFFVDTGVTPPTTPSAELSVAAIDPSALGHLGRDIDEALDSAIVLSAGEHLFVAVELLGSHPDVMCVIVNDVDAFDSDRNYWSTSNAGTGWVTLSSLGLNGNVLLSARGEPTD